jgi:hypothetical protein
MYASTSSSTVLRDSKTKCASIHPCSTFHSHRDVKFSHSQSYGRQCLNIRMNTEIAENTLHETPIRRFSPTDHTVAPFLSNTPLRRVSNTALKIIVRSAEEHAPESSQTPRWYRGKAGSTVMGIFMFIGVGWTTARWEGDGHVRGCSVLPVG